MSHLFSSQRKIPYTPSLDKNHFINCRQNLEVWQVWHKYGKEFIFVNMNISSGFRGRVRGVARNMKSMWPPLTAIVFMTFLQGRRRGGAWPPCLAGEPIRDTDFSNTCRAYAIYCNVMAIFRSAIWISLNKFKQKYFKIG